MTTQPKPKPLSPPLRSVGSEAPEPDDPPSEALQCPEGTLVEQAEQRLHQLDGLAAAALLTEGSELLQEILTHRLDSYADRHHGSREVCLKWWRSVPAKQRHQVDREARKHADVTEFYESCGLLPPVKPFADSDLARDTRRVLLRLVPSRASLVEAIQGPVSDRKQFVRKYLKVIEGFLHQALRISPTKPGSADARDSRILAEYHGGKTGSAISRRLGADPSLVRQVVHRHTEHSRWPLRTAIYCHLIKSLTPDEEST